MFCMFHSIIFRVFCTDWYSLFIEYACNFNPNETWNAVRNSRIAQLIGTILASLRVSHSKRKMQHNAQKWKAPEFARKVLSDNQVIGGKWWRWKFERFLEIKLFAQETLFQRWFALLLNFPIVPFWTTDPKFGNYVKINLKFHLVLKIATQKSF